jgi:4-hydroxybenzoate polyprenyltransferase
MVIYGVPLVYFRMKGFKLNFSESQVWVDRRFLIFSSIFFLAIIAMAVSALFLPFSVLAWLALLGGLALAYELPLLPVKGLKSTRLRDYGIIKMLVVAGVWLVVTVWIPVINAGEPLQDYFWMNNRFIFILSNAMMFDMRDMQKDLRNGHSTIPLKIGYGNARAAAVILLLINAAVILYNPVYQLQNFYIPLIFAILLNILIILLIRKKTRTEVYTFYVDGMLIMQFILVYAFTYLWSSI